jgi:glycosyltransferase involved in cell wall biosynthesis
MPEVGVIAIGRNEGERLRRCLNSVVGCTGCVVVYVDSNSTDGSVAMAREMGAEVVELDMSIPFSAARARNEGFERLMRVAPDVTFVQFIDGDCEVVAGWMDTARAALEARPELAIVCGRRRERYPEKSIYNRLADIEWNTPVGDVKACGGDAMMRVDAFRQVCGYNPAVIAGEEPEMCVRLRAKGWKIARLDAEMTIHDADMTRFGQFWKRMVRGGHAYAEGAWMHGRPPERHWVKQVRGVVLWAIVIPVTIVLFAALGSLLWPLWLAALAMLCSYPLQIARIAIRDGNRRKLPPSDAWAYATSVMIGKFAQAIGALKFWTGKLRGKRSALIEYKSSPSSPSPSSPSSPSSPTVTGNPGAASN